MNKKRAEEKFIEDAASALDSSVEGIDAGILSSLTRARRRAVDGLNGRGARSRARFRLPLSGLAAGLLLVFTVSVYFNYKGAIRLESYGNIEDMELLASIEQIELLDQLDFYAWLINEKEYKG